MEKPIFIAQLERAHGFEMQLASTEGYAPLRNVMACRQYVGPERPWQPQYALHPDGSLAGLNLAGLGMGDQDWLRVSQSLAGTRLEALNLRDNALGRSPDMAQMPQLRYLDLSNNQLKDFALPEGMGQLEHLWLSGNDFDDPVLLARARQGRHALLEYLHGIAQGEMEELYEARMLIIGEPKAGKSSLRNKLQRVSNPLATLSTKGIDVDLPQQDYNIFDHTTLSGQPVKFHYQTWDFGGQRQYHPTHQLFFAKSTLYVLVTNTDYDHKNEGDVEFWLETVQKLGAGSPVLRFQNAQSDRPDSADWKDINRRFGQMIRGTYTLNLDRVNPQEKDKYRAEDAKQFGLLQDAIKAQLKGLEHVGSKVTPTWRKIREAIAAAAKAAPCISLEHYRRICTDCGYPDPAFQDDLSKTFHTLGIFLHYQHNATLRNTLILQNEWAIDAVFAILDSRLLRAQKGKFEHKDLPKIWEAERYEGKRDELLQLLQEFELCYPLPAKRGYIAPQCLEKSPPKVAKLDAQGNEQWEDQYAWDERDNVRVDVTYDFLPRAVITRLVVKMHEHIAKEKQWAWQHGAVLKGDRLGYKNTQAYVEERYRKDEKPKLAIRLRGAYSEDLFREIQAKLADIHADFPNLEVDYVIYCNCEDCKQTPQPTPFNYHKDLLRYRRELKAETIECKTKKRQVPIADVLSGVISTAQAREDQARSIVVNGSFKDLESFMKEQQPTTPEKSNEGIYGALIAFIVVLPTIALCVSLMKSALAAALVIVATILVLMLVLVYAGTQSKTFSEDAFVKICERILSKIPGLGSLLTLIKGQ
jgi:internalin A